MHQSTQSTMPIRHNSSSSASAVPSSSTQPIVEQFQNTLQTHPHHSPRAESSSRTPVACKICRKRKVRCDGKKPCNSCLTSNRTCLYEEKKVQSQNNKPSKLRHHPFKAAASANPPSNILSFQPHSVSSDPLPTSYPPSNAPTLKCATGSPDKQKSVHTNQQDSQTLLETVFDIPKLPDPSQKTDGLPNRPTRIPYFRFLGPTAIAPGAPFREISLNLIRDQGSVKFSGIHQSEASPGPSTSSPKNLPDPGLDPPLSEDEFRRAVEIYYSHMGSFILSITKEDLLHSLSKKEASDALKLTISALAECIKPSSPTSDLASLRSGRAKSLVMPHLSLPSLDTTLTFLLIAYYEFAMDRDSGLWTWSGLAFRMAIDLGLHKSVGSGSMRKPVAWDDSESGLRERIFWSCYHLDRLISSGTGRVTTFIDSEIEIDLPPITTIPTEHSSLASMEPLLAPFHFLTRILILLGKISDEFNCCKRPDDISLTSERLAGVFAAFRAGLHEFHSHLPGILHFTSDNAKRYIEAEHGQAFLLMHLWFHALVIMTHTTSTGHGWNSLDIGPTDSKMFEWSRASVRTISDMIFFSHLFDANIYLSVPFASQAILIAACASIPDQSSPSDSLTNSFANHLSQTPDPSTKQSEWYDFNICSSALENMHVRWHGVSWLVTTLRSRACYETDVDLSTSGGAEVMTCDGSLMKKLTIRKSHGTPPFDTCGAPGPLVGFRFYINPKHFDRVCIKTQGFLKPASNPLKPCPIR